MPIPNVPQSKTVSIVFQSLKTNAFGFTATVMALQLTSPTPTHVFKCTLDTQLYFVMARLLFILSSVIDLLALWYFYTAKQFKRVMFYVFYAYHWIISLVLIAGAVHKFMIITHCPMAYTLLVTIMTLNCCFQMNAIIIMSGDFYRTIKYAYFGSNIVWTAIWYSLMVGSCSQIWDGSIGFIQALLSMTNFMVLLSGIYLGNTCFLARQWRWLTMFSFIGQILCYLIALLGKQQVIKCPSLVYFMNMYTIFGLVELILPLLLLIFLDNQSQDPRQEFYERYILIKKKESFSFKKPKK